jgi:basic amino acid/polyamine antiporter, APA family
MAAEPSKASDTLAPASFYTRQATGLVRAISVPSAIALNVTFMSIIYAVLVATQAPAAFSGADPFWTVVLCAVLCIFPILLYAMFTGIMPRTGGDYVFISRALHPWAGFAASFSITIWYLIANANAARLVAPYGLSTAFTTIGASIHNATLIRWGADVTSRNWGLISGIVVLIVIFAMLNAGLRSTLRIMKALFWLSLVAIAIAIVLLLINGRSAFTHSVAQYGGNYRAIIADAHNGGFTQTSGLNLRNIVLATPLAFTAFGYAIVTAYTGGEIRGRARAGMRGMIYSLLACAGLTAIVMALADRTFGVNFLGSATFLSNTASKQYPFGSPSFFFFYVSMLAHSSIVVVIIAISFIAGVLAVMPPTAMVASRNIFAWSFDRLIPQKANEVSERTHSPVIANTIVLVVQIGLLVFLTYAPATYINFIYTATMGQLLTFMLVAVAAMVFPYRRRAIYMNSPINQAIARIPAISIVGLLALAVYGLFFYSFLTANALGANVAVGEWAMVVIAVVGIAGYGVSYLVNRSRGVDLSIAFEELPPE